MKTSTFFTLALATIGANALPLDALKRTNGITDFDVLNFALTLEHIEDAFYTGALAKYSEADFEAAGLPKYARGRFVEIGEHERSHVEFLSGVLGNQATQPCTYTFPYTDVKSFAALSQVFEGVGTSAYAGAAHLLTNPDYITSSAVILSTEARQAAWVASAVNNVEPWSGNFDVPLDLNEVITLASSFIVSCPSTNPVLPAKAYPALTLDLASPSPSYPTSKKITPGSTISFEYSASAPAGKQLYAAFFTGLDVIFVEIVNGKAVVPSSLRGTVYTAISDCSSFDQLSTSVIAGPTILMIDFDSQGNVIA
ncbi:hypothetical protein JAAARDRAFT_193326 [Jaapia argillacea MUCL 33604]|uniref:Uncharacterized protein n=1 Tax=Jaapia argillacea MUCL 33604 TaxID=933084 RepID=A0A067PVF7_9AGAM|nr:hypothetical protein JAAARDRAFT_193326 [Jaapia argillacea MUCL 33604]